MANIMQINDLCKKHKNINDSIHGMISISKAATLIIDHPIFQRLRNLKQLGACLYVFPNAVHTRFEHSLGTYYLSKKILNSIKINSSTIDLIKPLMEIKNLESYFKRVDRIDLDDYIIELISIAGLCHDLGHGPYSHMFDDIFVPELQKKYKGTDFGPNILHENRSTELLKIIVQETELLQNTISDEEIDFICDLINPDKNIHKGYIYQIVSNSLNSLDVDKFDYLTRDSTTLGINISFQAGRLINNAKVINNIIMYPKQLISDIINLFNTRHSMHRTVYGHKGVISIDYMLQDLMLKLDDYMLYLELITDMKKFVDFTDYDVICDAKHNKTNPEIKTILDKILSHQLYPLVFSTTIQKTDKEYKLEDFLTEEMLENKSQYILHQSNIGYISGNKCNPLENIFLYSSKNDDVVKLLDSDLTKLMPNNFQETIIMIFYKEKDKVMTDKIKEELKLKIN